MPSPPLDLASLLDRHGASLRALALELVRDASLADDALQETWLGALRSPPRHGDAVGGWLATTLRNAVRALRRGERRRTRREQDVALARAEAVEDEAAALARTELVQRLVAAVQALDPPYRDAIWQRYFEGAAPRDIAVARGVPLETVKSRLKRGLGMLRLRLGEGDAERGTDWRAALVGAFALEKETAVATGASAGAAAAVIGGGVVMGVLVKVAAAVGLFALAVWVAASGLADGSTPNAGVVAAGGTPARASQGSSPADAPAFAANGTTAPAPGERVLAAAPPAAAGTAVVRGRCVDRAGNGIAGCRIQLRGSRGDTLGGADEQRLLERGFESLDLEQRSAADGRFEFAFVPPPFHYRCRVGDDGWTEVRRSLDTIAPASTHDLGDIVLVPGSRVHGRAVDRAGHAIAGVSVTLMQRVGSDAPPLTALPQATARTGLDGAFALREWLPLGDYVVMLGEDWVVDAPAVVALTRAVVVDVAVTASRPELPSIEGVVVDAQDRPIAAHDVAAVDERGRGLAATRTRPDGTFTLRAQRADARGEVRVQAFIGRDGAGVQSVAAAWGTRDVRLRMPEKVTLTVFVGDAAGAPIDGCSVRLLALDSAAWPLGGGGRLVRTGPDGLAVFAGLAAGARVVVAQLPEARGLRSWLEPVHVEGRSRRVDLRLGTEVARKLRVQAADGRPIAGSRVQLCELLRGDFTGDFEVADSGHWFASRTTGRRRVLVLDSGVTDAAGERALHGPAGRSLGLRVLGPGHVVVERTDVRLDDAGDLVVTVAIGARLRGRIEPPAMLAELRRLAGEPATGAPAQDRRPRIALRSVHAPAPRTTGHGTVPETERFVIGDDGRFDVDGLPAGVWHVDVGFTVSCALGSRTESFSLGEHTLVDGEVLDVAANLGELLPGTLRGRALVHDRPLASQQFVLELLDDVHGASPTGPSPTWRAVLVDDQGRFEFVGRPGRWRARRGAGDTHVVTEPVEIRRGEVVEHTFVFPAGEVRLRLLRPDGTPAAGVEVWSDARGRAVARTAADGTATFVLAPGTRPLHVLPERWIGVDASQARQSLEPGQRPLSAERLRVGAAEVTNGGSTFVEVRLPPEWAK